MTDFSSFEEGIADVLRCLRAYASGEGARSEAEIAGLEKWLNEHAKEEYRSLDYRDGVDEALCWLLGISKDDPECFVLETDMELQK